MELQDSNDLEESGERPISRSRRVRGKSYDLLVDDQYKKAPRRCNCVFARRHPRCCRVIGCCVGCWIAVLIGLGVFVFLLFSVTGAILTKDSIVDVYDLCDFNGTKLNINGFVHNPSVIPLTVESGNYTVYRKEHHQKLAFGSFDKPIVLTYGKVPLTNYSLVVNHGEPELIASAASYVFANNPMHLLVEADVVVSLFGISIPWSLTKDILLDKHTSHDQEPPFRWKSVNLAKNSRESAQIDATVIVKLRLPWLQVRVPRTVEVEVLHGQQVLATVHPEQGAESWSFATGWNTLSATAIVSRAQANDTGAAVNMLVAKQQLLLGFRGSKRYADVCWAQHVLSLARLVPDPNTNATPDLMKGLSIQKLTLTHANSQSVEADLTMHLGPAFIGGGNGGSDEPDEDHRITLHGRVPQMSVALSAAVAPIGSTPGAALPLSKPVVTATLQNWTLNGSPNGAVGVFVHDVVLAAQLADSVALRQRDSIIEVTARAAADDVFSDIVSQIRQRVVLGNGTSAMGSGAKASPFVQRMLDHLRINVTDISRSVVKADVTTQIASPAANVSFAVDLRHIDVDIHRIDGSSAGALLGTARMDLNVKGNDILIHVNSTKLVADSLAHVISDLLAKNTAISVSATGSSATAQSNVVTRILEHLTYNKTLVADPSLPVDPNTKFSFRGVATAGGAGGVGHAFVRFSMPANKYLSVTVPSAMVSVAAKSRGAGKHLLQVRTVPFRLTPGPQVQEVEVLVNVPDVDELGFEMDTIFAKKADQFQVTGMKTADLPPNLRGPNVRDTPLTDVLGQWHFNLDWTPPTDKPARGDGVLPSFGMKVVSSTVDTLKLHVTLNATLPTLPCEVSVGDVALDLLAQDVGRFGVTRQTQPANLPHVKIMSLTMDDVIIRTGVNILAFDLTLFARVADRSVYALQHVIYSVVSSPKPVGLWLHGSVAPSGPRTAPPFAVEYRFVLPKGGAGSNNALFICKDKPVIDLHFNPKELLTGKCSVDVSVLVWFQNPTVLPISLTKLDMKMTFDDPDGAFPVYRDPAYNVVIGYVRENALKFALEPSGVEPLNVIVTHPNQIHNGFHETCIRLGVRFYVKNKLAVKLVDGSALVGIENFRLLVRFANISIPLDKNTKYPRKCEDILHDEGLYNPPRPMLL